MPKLSLLIAQGFGSKNASNINSFVYTGGTHEILDSWSSRLSAHMPIPRERSIVLIVHRQHITFVPVKGTYKMILEDS